MERKRWNEIDIDIMNELKRSGEQSRERKVVGTEREFGVRWSELERRRSAREERGRQVQVRPVIDR